MNYTTKNKGWINLLLISKDSPLIQTLSQELPQWGVNISLVINLKNICQKVKEKSPGIVLLDGDMGISDVDTASILKVAQLGDGPSIIVCIGAKIDQTLGTILGELNNPYFISKPVLARSLLSLIEDISRKGENASLLLKKELPPERRKYIRARANFPLSCLFLNKEKTPPGLHQVRARVRNISYQGMMLYIRKKTLLPPVIDLEFYLPPMVSTLMVSGKIRWKRMGKLPHQQYVGIKFKGLTKQYRNSISRYIHSAISK